MTPEELASTVDAWYCSRSSRNVDLVGDFAGSNLGAVDGDSLLLLCFSDPELDFSYGFQLLHAVFLVERFLKRLYERRCTFIVFFTKKHASFCIPASTLPKDVPKYILAREVIVRHLQASLSKLHNVKVLNLADRSYHEVLQVLEEKHVYFVLVHDGAIKATRAQNDTLKQQVYIRLMLRRFLEHGYYVGLLNELKWQDSKIMLEIIEPRHKDSKGRPTENEEYSDCIEPAQDQQTVSSTADGSIGTPSPLGTELGSTTKDNKSMALNLIVQALTSLRGSFRWGPELDRLFSIYILHHVLLRDASLSGRRFLTQTFDNRLHRSAEEFLDRLIKVIVSLISQSPSSPIHLDCDLADLMDGRLFLLCLRQPESIVSRMPLALKDYYGKICNCLGLQSIRPNQVEGLPSVTYDGLALAATQARSEVLPFSSPFFDPHLSSIRLDINNNTKSSEAFEHIFQDLTHWHNHKKAIVQRSTPQLAKWQLRQEQRRRAEMRDYAASLTNASGKLLSPESIISGVHASKAKKSKTERSPGVQSHESSSSSGKRTQRTQAKVKNTAKEALFSKTVTEQKAKVIDAERKAFEAWDFQKKSLDALQDPGKVEMAMQRRSTFYSAERSSEVENDVLLYRIQNLLKLSGRHVKQYQQQASFEILAIAISKLELLTSRDLTEAEAVYASRFAEAIKMPLAFRATKESKRKLSFEFFIPGAISELRFSPCSFMLQYYGPYMRRDLDSQEDSRVSFSPDRWQREVLDQLDDNKSIFVVAPTSSGKTFISFYAMEKVLREDDNGVLVYIAPTKALVNQIAAEIHARFSKNYPEHSQKTTWAVHTRDYRVNDPMKCQILITVPHILQIMLLSAENAKSWSSKIRRIIFDEVHTISRAEDGVVWEQLLLLSPCPIIALSATVGNPAEFSHWLQSAQKSVGFELSLIEHAHRYSDLRKFIYKPPKEFNFHCVPLQGSKLGLGVDSDPCFAFVHPIATLVGRSDIPSDLSLEPRDCFLLYQALRKHETSQFPVPVDVDPEKCLPGVPRKQDIFAWQANLKSLLRSWMKIPSSPFQSVLATLRESMHGEQVDVLAAGRSGASGALQDDQSVTNSGMLDRGDIFETTLPLLCSLQEQNALPAILFNYDRSKCNILCEKICNVLEDSETLYKAKSPQWASKLKAWESHKRAVEQEKKKASCQKSSKKKASADDEGEDRTSRSERAKGTSDMGSGEKWEAFDPDAVLEQYSFTRPGAQASEVEKFVKELKRRDVNPVLIRALFRGLAVHHSGCNRVYRQVVEMLFRRGYLRVVFATGTLALGINMPCVTTVFCGDSVFLTALEYRQASGRAGRRGFDLLGNVIFHHVDDSKICRLVSSKLPDLSGHFPLTTTLVLRLFSVLHNSQHSKFAVQAVNSLLSHPRIYLGGQMYQHQVLHHLRFSIEYLRRNFLLSDDGAPQNFAGIVCHLYYTENAAFSFHALLVKGFFHMLSKSINNNPDHVMETLMLVLANIFGRKRFSKVSTIARSKARTSPSVVFLPPLPAEAFAILKTHDQDTLNIFKSYVATYVSQHLEDQEDNVLPFTGMKIGGDGMYLPYSPPTKIRSPFTALSGHGDSFATVSELCNSVRSGVFLEEAVIPKLSGNREIDEEEPLNAYLYDFWKHQDLRALEEDNGIRRSDIWFLLKDFSLVLATIETSLTSFVKGSVSDMEFLDLQGAGDQDEIDFSDDLEEEEDSVRNKQQEKKLQATLPERTKKKHKKVVADSWEDEANEDEGEEKADEPGSGQQSDDCYSAGDKSESSSMYRGSNGDLGRVLRAFQMLRKDFDMKFHKMWA